MIIEPRINVLGSSTFELQGEVHMLVTFLNKTLKDSGLIFGITRTNEGKIALTIYQIVGDKQ